MIAYILNDEGDVINTIVAEKEFLDVTYPSKWKEVIETEIISIPQLSDISDRQLGEGLWRENLINYQEYLDFIGPGVIPIYLKNLLDTLPDDNTGMPTLRKTTTGLLTSTQSYRFNDIVISLIRENQNWNIDMLREKWLVWEKL